MTEQEGAGLRNRQWLLARCGWTPPARSPTGSRCGRVLENIPRTFLRLFTGADEGKQLLRL